MEINWEATRANFDSKGFCQAKIARATLVDGEEVHKVTFSKILNGKYKYMQSPVARAVVAKLKELKVLVPKQAA